MPTTEIIQQPTAIRVEAHAAETPIVEIKNLNVSSKGRNNS